MRHGSLRLLRILLVLVIIAAAVSLTALAATNITSVSITLDAPVVGAHPDYTATFPSGAHYYSADFSNDEFLNDIVWYDETADRCMTPGSEVFQSAHEYSVYVYLTPDSGYEFGDNTSAVLNGQTPSYVSLVNRQLYIRYTFPMPAEPISSVSVTLDAPAVGAHPDYTAEFPSGANYYSYEYNTHYYRNDIVWHYSPNDPNSPAILDPDNDVFLAGNSYIVDIYLTARDGYSFTDSTTATFNGEGGSLEYRYYEDGTGRFFIRYAFPMPAEPISSVSVTLDAPAVGAHPDYTATFPSGAHYYSYEYNTDYYRNDIVWHYRPNGPNSSVMLDPDDDVFQAGNSYIVDIFLTARDGYSFTDSTTATFNGEDGSLDYHYAEETGQFFIRYTFPMLTEPISSIEVALDEPFAGNRPDYTAEYPSGAHYYSDDYSNDYYLNDIVWTDLTTGSDLPHESGEFQAGHEYKVTINVTPKSGYLFSGSASVKLNGESVRADVFEDGAMIVYSFPPAEEPQPISSVDVVLYVPAAGEEPDYDAWIAGYPCDVEQYTAGNVLNGVAWSDVTGERFYLDPGEDLFETGHVYQVSVNLVPWNGFKFTSDTKVSVNEEEAELRVTEYGEYYLVYTFPPALEIQPITSVSVTLDAPVIGAHPDYTAEFPSGAHYYSNEFAEWGYLNDIIWRDMTDEVYLLPGTDVFLAGHSYQVTVYLTAEYGYTFPSEDEISAALNGIDVSCNVLFGQLNLSCVFPPLADVTRGDVNLYGKVDAADLTVLARHVAGISFLTDPQALSNADVTGEGGISASDLTKLARFVAHIEDEL